MRVIKVLGLTLLLILACIWAVAQRLWEALNDAFNMSVLDIRGNWRIYTKDLKR